VKRPQRTILFRLARAYMVPTVALGALLGYAAQYLGSRSLDEELGRRLVSIAQATASVVLPEQLAGLSPGDESTRTYANLRRKLDDLRVRTAARRLQLLGPDLTIRVDTEAGVPIGAPGFEFEVDRAEFARALAGRATASVLFRGRDGAYYKRGFAPIAGSEGGAPAGVVAVLGSAEYFAQLDRFRRFIWLYGALGTAAVIIVSAAVARRITRPLSELAQSADRIGRGDLNHAVTVPASGDEIARLAETLDDMRRSLAARDERMQMMLAGIAHEVRNPLGGMELYAGILREDLAQDREKLEHVARIERELGHLKRVVAEFLEYARRPRPELAAVLCKDLLEEVASVLAKDAADAGVECRVMADGEPKVRADASQLRRALLNLLRNSIQATPRGGHVRLSCAAGPGERVLLMVEDNGAGIPADRLPHLFTPFYTTKEKGTGLGLAFVREIVRDSGGEVRVDSEPGRGSTFVIELPAS
jgi:signal transduction histidine kinase